MTVGSSQGVSVPLAPGQAVDAEITASRGVMKVRIVYTAYLTGSSAINYGGRFKGHHFWGLDIGSVMSAANLPLTRTFTEDIEIGFYANDQVVLTDPVSNKTVARFFGAARPGVGGQPMPERKTA